MVRLGRREEPFYGSGWGDSAEGRAHPAGGESQPTAFLVCLHQRQAHFDGPAADLPASQTDQAGWSDAVLADGSAGGISTGRATRQPVSGHHHRGKNLSLSAEAGPAEALAGGFGVGNAALSEAGGPVQNRLTEAPVPDDASSHALRLCLHRKDGKGTNFFLPPHV